MNFYLQYTALCHEAYTAGSEVITADNPTAAMEFLISRLKKIGYTNVRITRCKETKEPE